jgi:hypothetical protein
VVEPQPNNNETMSSNPNTLPKNPIIQLLVNINASEITVAANIKKF